MVRRMDVGDDRGSAAVGKALDLLVALAQDDGRTPLAAHARALLLPLSTAHRLAAALERRRLIVRLGRGHYGVGLQLSDFTLSGNRDQTNARMARPFLRVLSRQVGGAAHLGIWRGDMVTYLVKESGSTDALFTREGRQLEAYCTAIGKVLLAALPVSERARYLDAGPFVALTSATITDPAELQDELDRVKKLGFALDQGEAADGLACIAVPVHDPRDNVIAAISLSRVGDTFSERGPLAALQRCATEIGGRMRCSPEAISGASNINGIGA
jgi:DNA-binding IclR family transcriptional regulator